MGEGDIGMVYHEKFGCIALNIRGTYHQGSNQTISNPKRNTKFYVGVQAALPVASPTHCPSTSSNGFNALQPNSGSACARG